MNSPPAGDRDEAERASPASIQVSGTGAVLSAVRAVRRGDREAFGRVVERYQKRLFGLILMMLRDPPGAEEVTQDAFVRALIHLDRYDESRPFYPWLATIAVRLGQTWIRRNMRVRVREVLPSTRSTTPPQPAIPSASSLPTKQAGRCGERSQRSHQENAPPSSCTTARN